MEMAAHPKVSPIMRSGGNDNFLEAILHDEINGLVSTGTDFDSATCYNNVFPPRLSRRTRICSVYKVH